MPRTRLTEQEDEALPPDRTVQVVGAQVRSVAGIPTDCVGQRTDLIFLRKRKLCDRCLTSPMAPTFESQPDSPGRTSNAETKRPAIDATCAPLVHRQGRRDSNSTSGYCFAVLLSSGAGRPKRCRSKNAKE